MLQHTPTRQTGKGVAVNAKPKFENQDLFWQGFASWRSFSFIHFILWLGINIASPSFFYALFYSGH